MIKTLDKIKNLFGADSALLRDSNTAELSVENEDVAIVIERHVVFYDYAFVFKSAARMGDEQPALSEPAQVIFPDWFDVLVVLPGAIF
jgi:hypothetical protein